MTRTLKVFLSLFATLTISAQAAPTPIAPVLSQTNRGVEMSVPLEAGTWPMTYQWYRETGTIRKVRVAIPAPEGIQAIFVLTATSKPGVYTCEVTNSAGTVTSRSVKLSLTKSPSAPSIAVTIKQP